jgi:hypothetical protein
MQRDTDLLVKLRLAEAGSFPGELPELLHDAADFVEAGLENREVEVPKVLGNIVDLHEKIARDMAPKGGRLRCKRCDNAGPIGPGEIARYLKVGWPSCCEDQMTLDVHVDDLQGAQAGRPGQGVPGEALAIEHANDTLLRNYDAEMRALEGCSSALGPIKDDPAALDRIYSYLAAKFPHREDLKAR